MLYSCDFTLLPLNPTHHTDHSDSLIDLMAVSDPARVVHHGQLPGPCIPKQDFLFLVYKTASPMNEDKLISYSNLKDSKPWQPVVGCGPGGLEQCSINSGNVDSMVDNFKQMLIYMRVLDGHAPVVTKRVKNPPTPRITPSMRLL